MNRVKFLKDNHSKPIDEFNIIQTENSFIVSFKPKSPEEETRDFEYEYGRPQFYLIDLGDYFASRIEKCNLKDYDTEVTKAISHLKELTINTPRASLNTSEFKEELQKQIEYFQFLRSENERQPIKNQKNQKIRWNANVRVLAYLFNKLAAEGYIDIPMTKGNNSISKLASICSDFLDTGSSQEYLKRAFNDNKLNEEDFKIELPDLKNFKRI